MNLWFQFVSYTSLEKYETELYTYLVLQHNHRQKISVEEFNRDIASILTIKKKISVLNVDLLHLVSLLSTPNHSLTTEKPAHGIGIIALCSRVWFWITNVSRNTHPRLYILITFCKKRAHKVETWKTKTYFKRVHQILIQP